MDLLFFMIAVCPAVIAAGIGFGKEKRSWKAWVLKAAVWFYGITFVNLMMLYARGWGAFRFEFLSVQFLLKYMVCSMFAIVLMLCMKNMIQTKRWHRFLIVPFVHFVNFVKKAYRKIKTVHAVPFYGRSVGIAASCALSFLICVFAPLDLYFNNQGEFWFDLYILLPYVIGMFLAAAFTGSMLALVCFRVQRRLYQCLWIMEFVLFVCTYIQGNYLTKYLPPLDGTEFDWADYADGRSETIILWSAVLLVTVLLLLALPWKKFYRMANGVFGGMTAMLLLTLCIEGVMTFGYQDKADAVVTTKNQFEMSQDRNFVILLLDALDTGVFQEMLEDHPEYEEVFADFTYYPDMMGAYSFTSRSVPFLLSGEWFENQELFEKYHERVYKESGLLKRMEEEGYQLGIYEPELPLTGRSIFRFDNVCAYQVNIRSHLEFAGLQLKLAGFKYAPFAWKKYCIIDMDEFTKIREISSVNEQQASFDNHVFYEDLKNREITSTDEKCFKFIHLEGAHVPFRYDREVNVIEDGTYEQNIEASVTLTDAYLKKLKAAGVYDNSVIIVMADHGFNWDDVHGRQDPFLMIKGMGEKHRMRISQAPVSFEDLQLAYARLLDGKPSDCVFDWKAGDQRERRFLWFEYTKEDYMVEYLQKGHASDCTSMYPTGREYRQ